VLARNRSSRHLDRANQTTTNATRKPVTRYFTHGTVLFSLSSFILRITSERVAAELYIACQTQRRSQSTAQQRMDEFYRINKHYAVTTQWLVRRNAAATVDNVLQTLRDFDGSVVVLCSLLFSLLT